MQSTFYPIIPDGGGCSIPIIGGPICFGICLPIRFLWTAARIFTMMKY